MEQKPCINLKERFGKRFKVAVEESYESSIPGRCLDPWLFQLVGSRGHVCPWGGDLLAVCIDGHRNLCRRLLREPWVASSQNGEDGANAVFHVDDFDKACEYAKLYKRRRYTDEQRAKMVQRIKDYQWTSRSSTTS